LKGFLLLDLISSTGFKRCGYISQMTASACNDLLSLSL